VGALNQVACVWRYRDAAHRAEQQASLHADADWIDLAALR